MDADEVGEVTTDGRLRFRGRIEEDDWVAMTRAEIKISLTRPLWLVALSIPAIVSLSLFWLLLSSGLDLVGKVMMVCCAVFLAIVWALAPERDWNAREVYRRNADKILTSEVVLDRDGFRLENSLAKVEMRWDGVGGVLEMAEGILFFSTACTAYFWLPDRVLDENLRDRICDLALTLGLRVVHVGSTRARRDR